MAPIYRLITNARSSIDLTMYELRDTTGERDLTAAASRGVDVRVVLDHHLERARNTSAYAYLAHHGVHVVWAPGDETWHQKTLTVDHNTSVIMTLNMVSSDYPGTRDFALFDTNPVDVAAIETIFDADYTGRSVEPHHGDGSDLVWSPGSEPAILQVIGSAHTTLAVENEEMDDSAVTTALEDAARRGVQVEVTMTAGREWDRAFDELAVAGVHVRTYPDSSWALYIHAKAIVADQGQPDQQAFVGSENFSAASLDYNRELGVITTTQTVVQALGAAMSSDFADGTAWSS